MKKMSILLALAGLAFANLVFANAVVTSATGSVRVQTGTAAAKTLRVGDQVNQGDTVTTGPTSSVVLKFDDGQVAALTSNSSMTVTAYQYNKQAGSGNVLLSLISGGMRAITGLIGKATPERVSYRAATSTIGIRGTDVTIATAGGNVVVSVTEGSISFTFGGQTVVVPTGRAVDATPDGSSSQGAFNQVQGQLQPTTLLMTILDALGGLTGLTNAINQAAPGSPPGGQTPTAPGEGSGSGQGTPTGPTGPTGGGAGGGTASGN
jgi:hypothetical protein